MRDPTSATGEPLLIGLATMARQLLERPDLETTLEVVVAMAPTLVTGCDHSSITMSRRKQAITAAGDDIATRADHLQYDLNEGPCLDAFKHDAVLSNDLSSDHRWPRWGPEAAQGTGVRSVLSLRLYAAGRSFGSLNLYATHRQAYDAQASINALVLATHATVAIAHVRTKTNLETSLDTRTVIGQACGIMMERYQLTPTMAFDLLVRLSQTSNTKLQVIANQIVGTRKLPR
ncbi:GAF and ANTAR domain-containing protein [Micromonospora sp. NPDC050397]|uniref:GAF and ANTAR domain-containing protein n=1 Tax=Micromonospora sp. NPDC050397 TaxID=3364279 RepID=UPI00384D7089